MYFQNPYCPVDKLPDLFFNAVIHVCRQTGAPPEVVVADAFAATTTLTQRLFKVKSLNGSLMPITINTLSLAPTTVGKGESYRMWFQSPKVFEGGNSARMIDRVSIDDLLSQDLSLSALMSELVGVGKSVSIQLEDGYSFLEGRLMRPDAISKLAQGWSGPPSMKHGRHRDNKVSNEPCLAIGLRIQPELTYDFLKRDKGRSWNLGLWPRFMTFCHDPQRFPVTPWHAATGPSMASIFPLMERFGTLLHAASDSGDFARKVLVMDTFANAHLREIAYWIKGQMNGEFHDIQNAAGRAAENTLRLASNFHVVCQGERPISREMIERAWAFVYWSLGQARNVFVHALQPPPKPVIVKPIKLMKLPSQHQRLKSDMQFMLDCIVARSGYFQNGKLPVAEVALLTGFHKTRFLSALYWLVTGNWVEVEGHEVNGTIRLLVPQGISAPCGDVPYMLTSSHQ
jgi:hypothetical protein